MVDEQASRSRWTRAASALSWGLGVSATRLAGAHETVDIGGTALRLLMSSRGDRGAHARPACGAPALVARLANRSADADDLMLRDQSPASRIAATLPSYPWRCTAVAWRTSNGRTVARVAEFIVAISSNTPSTGGGRSQP